jgi:DNA polymerase I
MDWSALRQFPHAWAIDFEFTQPKGSGERPVLICMSARDLLSDQCLDFNEAQLRLGQPPFDTQHDVFVAYAARAEMSCFAALHWPIPRYILDLNIEYRHYRNDGVQHSHKLLDAMHYFGLPTIG